MNIGLLVNEVCPPHRPSLYKAKMPGKLAQELSFVGPVASFARRQRMTFSTKLSFDFLKA
jgi:hypothetical protein